MGRRTSKNRRRKTRGIMEQNLLEDYWEGFYALSDTVVAECSDVDGENASFKVYSLADGKVLHEGSIPVKEDTLFSALAGKIRADSGYGISLRISDAAANPDRHETICNILGNHERFELVRIQNLIRTIRRKGLSVFGGPIGGQDLSEGCEGFYLLADGDLLYCRDTDAWDDEDVDSIVDGVVEYRVLDPRRFSLDGSDRRLFGYLVGDRFSELAESLYATHGKVLSMFGPDDEMFDRLKKALEGDRESAAIASHRLKTDICVRTGST